MQKYIATWLLVVLAVMPICQSSQAQGVGDLLVAPTRVELEGRKRLAEVTLVNRGNTEATYRISFQNMHMDENGVYSVIKEPIANEKFADKVIRYAPRQVRLKAGESQTIRLMLRKPRGLEAGEYRSHLLFRAVPSDTSGRSIESVKNKDKSLSVQLTPIFGISIPVIARHGKLDPVTVDITTANMMLDNTVEPKAGEKAYKLNLNFERSGGHSLYGDIKVIHNGDTVNQLRGISLFSPYPSRKVKLNLVLKGVSSGDKLKVVYHSRKAEDDIYASKEVIVP